jgi:RHS repeat-associated protein
VRDGNTVAFTYDELNQLARENNQELNKTVTNAYDVGGNITTKTEYAYTIGTLGTPTKTYTYSYGDTNWKDKLTSYDGKSISYDNIGNPTSYDGWTYTWEAGRQLASASTTGTSISYKYDDNGIRTSKTVNSVTTDYTLFGDKVVVESNGTDTLKYTYDNVGNLVGMNLNGTDYFYEFNAQGDVIGIVNTSATKVVSYVYDSWGKVLSTTGSLASTVEAKNPFRYRGYRYDAETGLYYLQSRYYSPSWGRFLNADAVIGKPGQLLASNMFAYCYNNPVNLSDPDGETPIQAAFAAIFAIAGWYFGDYVAKSLGYYSGTMYWTVRSAVAFGGVALGWFAGWALTSIASRYLLANLTVLAKLPDWVLWTIGLTGSSGLTLNKIANAVTLAAADSNKVWHIMQSHHYWGRVGAYNWGQISNIIVSMLRNGYSSAYTAGNQIYSYYYSGQIVQVVTRNVNGVIKIVDAWVKN